MTDLTIAEWCAVLKPPMTEKQLRAIIKALGWKPTAWRHTGHPGHPAATYDTTRITSLHRALLPFLTIGDA